MPAVPLPSYTPGVSGLLPASPAPCQVLQLAHEWHQIWVAAVWSLKPVTVLVVNWVPAALWVTSW